MRAAPRGVRRAALGVPALAWLAGLLGSWLLACWGLSGHLLAHAERVEARALTGWRWHLGSPGALVGGAPVGLLATFRDDALLGRSDADGGFLSLAFEGQRLDARRFSRLELELALDQPTTLQLFHRETLDGPVIAAPPIPLGRGRQTLRLELDRLPWHAQVYERGAPVGPAKLSAWGGDGGLVASLRLHPASDPGVLFALGELRILPPRRDRTALDDRRPPGGAAESLPVTSIGLLGRRPASILMAREAARMAGPEPLLRPVPALPLPSPWIPLAVALVLLGGAAAAPRQRRRLLLAAFLAAAGSALLTPLAAAAGVDGRFGTLTVAGIPVLRLFCGLALLGSGLALLRELGTPPGLWRLRGAGWWIAIALPLLLLPALVLSGRPLVEPETLLLRFGGYLPWALLQQWILQVLLVRALGGHGRACALAGGAVLFGWLHFPNFELMVLTSALALLVGVHFRRYGALLPLALAHAAAGTLALTLLPRQWLWDGTVGMRYFGGG